LVAWAWLSMNLSIADLENGGHPHGMRRKPVYTLTGAYHEKGTDKGKGYEYRDRLTDIWMNYNGGWRLVASHYSLSSSH